MHLKTSKYFYCAEVLKLLMSDYRVYLYGSNLFFNLSGEDKIKEIFDPYFAPAKGPPSNPLSHQLKPKNTLGPQATSSLFKEYS